MNREMIHRGPDAEGIYPGERVTLGMRRLSVIDLKSGDQPICSSSGRIVVVFNGEIYNYLELKETLIKKGISFRTTSDTEVLANLFEEYGVDCFRMLDGMFAGALFDIPAQKLYLVRDRMGEKPLYYYKDSEKLVFGSEMRCLQRVPDVPKELNRAALNFFFQYTYIPSPISIYRNVWKLFPGHFLEISREGAVIDHSYWELKKNPEYEKLSYEEAKEELFRRVNESVRTRMRSDVPFGAFLSGGLDSGTIAAMMMRNSEQPVRTFTIGLNTPYDESGRAKKMAEHIGTEHHTFLLDYRDSIQAVSEITEHMDEPFGDSSCIPEYLVSALASDSVKVALTGDAGDELLLGYSKYLINYYADRYLKLPPFLRSHVVEPIYRRMPDRSRLSRMIGKVIKYSGEDAFQRRNRLMQLGFKDEECARLFRADYYDLSAQKLISGYYDNSVGGDIEKTQYLDLHIVLEGDMLAKVDRMSMRNSLETRTPLLSNDLVEFCYSLPSEYKLKGKTLKRLMKDTFRGLFPEGYEKLPKSGFGVPVDEWFRKEMKEELLDLLNESYLKAQSIFNYDYVRSILEEHFSGRVNRKSEIWNLYVFQKWYKKQMAE